MIMLRQKAAIRANAQIRQRRSRRRLSSLYFLIELNVTTSQTTVGVDVLISQKTIRLAMIG